MREPSTIDHEMLINQFLSCSKSNHHDIFYDNPF